MQAVSRKPSDVGPSRLGALAKLPVFLDLAGKPVLVAGGSAAAAWKAELAAAAGAEVLIHAPVVSVEMQALLHRGAASGSIVHRGSVWTEQALRHTALAIADAADETEAQAFATAAKAAGVICNVIDRPAFSTVQFGAVVNRSPVVVGISTDGAAPVLGQAIRRRIETLLPPGLATWAALAQSIRGRVMGRLTSVSQRRRFWERFAAQAFGTAPGSTARSTVDQLIDTVAGAAGGGRVTLVGAGPGDAELLTLKAVRAMQAADVILFDDLVSADVLELARREARRMLVGKRGGRESCRQEEINDLMARLARAGKHVVRLKSGDPFIFGRAGEEIARLEAAGIPVDIVPGITAAVAMASALRVSLTHRDHAHSLRFVTGHSRKGGLPSDIDWTGIADPKTTAIFYMGGRTAPAIADRLIAEGLSPLTPAVLAMSLTRPEERHWAGTLGQLQAGMASRDTDGPVLIGIGAVFSTACRAAGDAAHTVAQVRSAAT